MKVKVEIELEIPGDGKECTEQYLHQYVFDGLTNYACTRHLSDALKWMVEDAKEGSTNCEQLVEYHQKWGRILSNNNVFFSVKILDD